MDMDICFDPLFFFSLTVPGGTVIQEETDTMLSQRMYPSDCLSPSLPFCVCMSVSVALWFIVDTHQTCNRPIFALIKRDIHPFEHADVYAVQDGS